MLEILDSDENFDIIPLTHNLDGFDVDESKLLSGECLKSRPIGMGNFKSSPKR